MEKAKGIKWQHQFREIIPSVLKKPEWEIDENPFQIWKEN